MTMTEMTNDQLMAELQDASLDLRHGGAVATRHYDRCFREVERRLSVVISERRAECRDHQSTKMLLNQYRDAAYRANDECSYMKKSYEALLSAHNALADDRLRIVEQLDAMRKVLETVFADLVEVSHSS